MRYNQFGDADVDVSVIGLGGHEFFDGGVRGFNPQEREEAITPGIHLDGYGGKQRLDLVRTALESGVNFFDVTIDEEKDALGRNLEELDPTPEIFVQTRPAGPVDTADYDSLREEVERVAGLLRRNRVEMLNFGGRGSLDTDPDFLSEVGRNIERLKDDGLIRFASADAADEEGYLRAIDTGAFDSISLGFHFARPGPADEILPAAAREGMAVVARAVFMKGRLFTMAEQAGIDDLDAVARASIRWCLGHEAVTSVLVGADTAEEFERNLQASEEGEPTERDREIIDRLRKTPAYEATQG